jgi:hypothetical protein
VTVAERGDGVLIERNVQIAIVNDDEVIAGAVHFVEVQKHGKKWDAQRAYAGLGKLSSPHCDKSSR